MMNYRYQIIEKTVCYDGFFRLERYRLRHELFAGGLSVEITRELLERGHAAAVVLYDPHLDSVVMVEQFRIGALDSPGGPWMLEFVAGIVEENEMPEAVVRRESVEEAACEIEELIPIATYTLSPGACSERMHVFCARVDASRAGGIHGLVDEGEDIRVRVLRFEEAFAMLEAEEISSATPIIGLQWLALNRDVLRKKWIGASEP